MLEFVWLTLVLVSGFGMGLYVGYKLAPIRVTYAPMPFPPLAPDGMPDPHIMETEAGRRAFLAGLNNGTYGRAEAAKVEQSEEAGK